jgi:hypothetical protein
MRVILTVEVELEHVSGLFISREAAADELVDVIQDADPGDLYIEDSEYRVASLTATAVLP